MENASNALLMAGGILIAMLVLAVAITIFVQYGHLGNTYSTKMSQQEVVKFNDNFTIFLGRDNITAAEIASLVNFVREYIEQNEIANTEITVIVDRVNYSNMNDNEIVKFVKENSTKTGQDNVEIKKYYKCSASNIRYDGPYGMVNYIKFEEIR